MRGVICAVLLLFSCPAVGGAKVYPWRWVFVSRGLRKDSDVDEIREIVRTAAAHGVNGVAFSGSYRADMPETLRRLKEVRRICERKRIEIIPLLFSAGYGGTVLRKNKNLAAGIPVEDALFVVRGGEARFVPDPKVQFLNGGFEEHDGNRLKGYRFHDKPGEVSFVDTEVFRSGKASLRFENFGKYRHGHGRVMQEISVKPHRCYRVSCWVKTENLQPSGRLSVQVLVEHGRALAPWKLRISSTADWQEVVLGFNSLEYAKVRVYAGIWRGKSGKFWIDDFKVEEVGLVNVLRRAGTPVSVRSERDDTVYEEGRDYERITDPRLNFRFNHEGPPIRLLPGSRIREGEQLRVGYYHGIAIHGGQVSVCMSEPETYEVWRERARLIHERLAPKKYLLSMDEIRAGGSCKACKDRDISMAQILGDCITRQVKILRKLNPKAEILIWSDMLDPTHNAHDDYYLVDGDFTGSWDYVPKDLVIACWGGKERPKSLKHFSSFGFRTFAAAYYDADNLDDVKGWLQALDKTSKAVGIMYTTWRNKYDLLGPFGDLVRNRKR